MRHFYRERGSARRHIAHADRPAMLGDNAVTDAETQSGALAYRFRRVERIEHPRCILYAGTAVGKLDEQPVFVSSRSHPEIPFVGMLEHGVNGVVNHVEDHLLRLGG